MELTQALRRAALLKGPQLALEFDGEQFTWSAFADRVARLAAAYRSLGMGPGDRVAVLAVNSGRYVEQFFAPLWGGGMMVPINTRWSVPEMIYALEDSTPVLLVVDAQHSHLVSDLLKGAPSIRHVILAEPQGEGELLDYEALIAEAAPAPDAGRGGDNVAAIFYTGGTTGRSKGVMLTHDNLFFNALAGLSNLFFHPNTVHIHTGPLFHMAAGARIYTTTVAMGRHVVVPGFDPLTVLKTIQEKHVTHMVLAPTMLNMLVNHPDFQDYDLSSLELLSYGASPMAEALIRKIIELVPQAKIVQSYGMTELSPVATSLSPECHWPDHPLFSKVTSAGQPIFFCDVRIVDEGDQDVPRGEIGEIVVRGPNVMKGYWNKPELTAEALRGGYMHTGDAGYMDEDGFVFLVDRVKDMIISGGENVFSAEVEDVLMKHPAVLECAVIGIPDEKWGEKVHAIVRFKAGEAAGSDDLTAHCRSLLGGYKIPRSFDFWTDPLPQSGAGKILKSELRKPFWDRKDRGIS